MTWDPQIMGNVADWVSGIGTILAVAVWPIQLNIERYRSRKAEEKSIIKPVYTDWKHIVSFLETASDDLDRFGAECDDYYPQIDEYNPVQADIDKPIVSPKSYEQKIIDTFKGIDKAADAFEEMHPLMSSKKWHVLMDAVDSARSEFEVIQFTYKGISVSQGSLHHVDVDLTKIHAADKLVDELMK